MTASDALGFRAQSDPSDAEAPLIAGSKLPFVPYGLIFAAGLVALLLFGMTAFAFGAVEDVTRRTAQEALDKAGADWARPIVSGQWVTLEGAPPSEAEAELAVIAVRNARAQTLFGSASPITRVISRFDGDGARVDVGPKAPSAPEAPAQASEARLRTPSPGTLADAQCADPMANLFQQATIEFEKNSDVIGSDSFQLLDSVARVASWCAGELRIEGHTDASGAEDFNQDLSLRRAEAVRAALVDRGVDPARMKIEGYGSSRPIADNSDPDGRDRNRRIEMRLIPQSTSPT